jgi:hypothetical protein
MTCMAKKIDDADSLSATVRVPKAVVERFNFYLQRSPTQPDDRRGQLAAIINRPVFPTRPPINHAPDYIWHPPRHGVYLRSQAST